MTDMHHLYICVFPSGEKCPCGAWVTPAFHIDTGKVDNFPCDPVQPTSHSGQHAVANSLIDGDVLNFQSNGDLNSDSEQKYELNCKFDQKDTTHPACEATDSLQNPDSPVKSCRVLEKRGDLFSCDKSFSLAHCVSEDLEMSKGIAKIFKNKFCGVPELMKQDKTTGDVATLQRGGRFIYYLVTKDRYFQKPTYGSLESSLVAMRRHAVQYGVRNVAMPKIGCGLDKLDWGRVRSLIETVFDDTDIHFTVFCL